MVWRTNPRVVFLFAFFLHIFSTNAFAASLTLTKPVTLNGVTFKTLDPDKSLLEQYQAKTATTRILYAKQFQVKVTKGKTTETFTTLDSLKIYVRGKDKGLSFINNISSYVVNANDGAKWTLRDELTSDHLEKYDYLTDRITSDMIKDYAESLKADNMELQEMLVQSAEEAMQSAQELYAEIFEAASNQAGGSVWGMLLGLLGCPDSGSGCWLDDDCDGVHNSADSNSEDPNRQTDWDQDGDNDITAESEGGVLMFSSYFEKLGVTNESFLDLIVIYDSYNTEMVTNVTTMKANIIQLLEAH